MQQTATINPFQPGPNFSRDAQARMFKTDPARAKSLFEAQKRERDREPNPWVRATINRTRQAEILKNDPQLAATLKAAAARVN